MTREERRREVKKNRLALAFIIIELIAVAILIPLAISRLGKKNDNKPDTVNTTDAGSIISPGANTGINTDETHTSKSADGENNGTESKDPVNTDNKINTDSGDTVPSGSFLQLSYRTHHRQLVFPGGFIHDRRRCIRGKAPFDQPPAELSQHPCAEKNDHGRAVGGK